ncbi:MAG: hypothetical protein Q7T11_03990, partial [Deltaproteobacteria bacterium]|nr:hypothetical protein [Deltaproteobacteria bacterium]
MKTRLMIIALAFVTLHCGEASRITPTPPDPDIDPRQTITGPLVRYESCDDLVAQLKTKAIEQMEARLASYNQCWDWEDYGCADCVYDAAPMADGAQASPVASSEESPVFTGTNLQEEGIDESDIMKTDGHV